jgi:hypothetical protein
LSPSRQDQEHRQNPEKYPQTWFEKTDTLRKLKLLDSLAVGQAWRYILTQKIFNTQINTWSAIFKELTLTDTASPPSLSPSDVESISSPSPSELESFSSAFSSMNCNQVKTENVVTA